MDYQVDKDSILKLFAEYYLFANSIPKQIYKYRSFNEHNIKNLSNNQLWFSYVDEFNDPFESVLRAPVERWKEELIRQGESFTDEEIDSIATEYCEVFTKYKHLLSACSFSTKNNDILMWAHYANSHSGFCVEFTPVEDIQFFATLLRVEYDKHLLPTDLLANQNSFLKHLFLRKSDYWNYEDEVRLLKKEKGAYSYSPKSVKSIIFGVNASDDDKHLIKRIMGPEIEYKQCVLSKSGFHIDVVPESY